jgi:hypothetical protein
MRIERGASRCGTVAVVARLARQRGFGVLERCRERLVALAFERNQQVVRAGLDRALRETRGAQQRRGWLRSP